MWYRQFSVEGKVALVTGAGRGIGYAIALGLAEAGADVVITSRTSGELKKLAEKIEGTGKKAFPVVADVGNLKDIEQLIEATKKEFGRIDILVNNAAKTTKSTFLDEKEAAWDEAMNTNLKGMYFLSQAAAKMMKTQGGGVIINFASAAGFMPAPLGSIYSITKAGIIHATKALAKELAPYNIRVNALAPGYTRTPIIQTYLDADSSAEERMKSHTPLGRIAEPEEYVGTVLYLASEASGFATGATMLVEGGLIITGIG